MKTVNEIYLEIGQGIFDLIEFDNWTEAKLFIIRLFKAVRFNGNYVLEDGSKKYLDVRSIEIETDSIHDLHTITTEGGHNRWNRLEFTLFPDFKFDLQFIWDQELQDEVDGYNNELKS